MSIDQAARHKIRVHLAAGRVVVFMKGSRAAPQCGFSASVVDILDSYLDDYHTVDVLADEQVREAIKEHSDWPTLPQIFVGGEFVGGTDIVRELDERDELAGILGVQVEAPAPKIACSPEAAAAFKDALSDAEGEHLRLQIDGRWLHDLSLGPAKVGDIVAPLADLTVRLDRASARRANGVSIAWVEGPEGAGFRIDNPNAPQGVRDLSVADLSSRLEKGLRLIDVRTPAEHHRAAISGAELLDEALAQELTELPKDTPLAFHCHHGGRSRRVAEQFVALGFREIYNVAGGIDAWSLEIDSKIERY